MNRIFASITLTEQAAASINSNADEIALELRTPADIKSWRELADHLRNPRSGVPTTEDLSLCMSIALAIHNLRHEDKKYAVGGAIITYERRVL